MKPKKNSERMLIITQGVAAMLLRLFDAMYKRGVNDAAMCGDNGMMREFLAKTSEPGVFGILDDDTSDDWIYFQIQVEREIWEKGFREPYMRYCRNMGRYGRNYLSVGFLCALDWYRMGIQHYMEYGCKNMAMFNTRQKVYLTKGGETAKMSNERMVSDTQDMCFKRKKIDSMSESKWALSGFQYMNFVKGIGIGAIGKYDSMT